MEHTYQEMSKRLSEQGIEHRTITLDDESLLLISGYGGRVYGPFDGPQGPCPMWVPEAFSDRDAFAALLASGAWNLGGERMWLGPEITYIIEDRTDYWGTFVVPACIDPAPHQFEDARDRSGHGVSMRREGSLLARHTGEGTVDFRARVEVTPSPSPFRFAGPPGHPLRGLDCAGYTVAIDIERTEGRMAPLETWDLVQVPCGGTVVVPTVGQAEVTDYYEPAGELVEIQKGAALVTLTGEDKFKIGFKAPCAVGRAGYVLPLKDGTFRLLVRQSAVDVSAPYGEEPDFAPGIMGDPIHVYSDDGPLGGFGELESRGLPTGSDTDRLSAADRFTSWWFRGTRDDIDTACQTLLGVSIGEAMR